MGKWPLVRLGDVGKIVTGSTPRTSDRSNYSSRDICFYKPGDFDEGKLNYLDGSIDMISENAREKVRMLPPNSVLVTCIGIIGKVGILAHEATCNQQINAIIPNFNVDSRALAYILLRNQAQLKEFANAPLVPIINKTTFASIKIPLPPLDIQKHIANTLDKTQEIIDGHKKTLAELDNLIKAVFYEMFGDPVTNEKHWDQKKLSMLSSLVSGGTPSREFPEYFNGDIPWITTVALGKLFISDEDAVEYITEDAVENSATKKIPPGSVLFGVRVGVGKVAINLVEMCTNQDVVAITDIDKRLNNIFLMETLKKYSRLYSSQQRGATIKGITSKILQDTLIPIPPFDLQNKFANIVTKIEEQKALVKQAIAESEHLFKSLMSEYFD